MSAEQLAAGYSSYVSTDEVTREAADPQAGAEREPTTSIHSTVCIHGLDTED